LANNLYHSNPVNTITITGGNGISSLTGFSAQALQSIQLDDTYLNNIFKNSNDYVKRYEVIETTEDILALSVAWKRLRDNREKIPVYINSLLSTSLFEKVTSEDRERATVIRDYFSKKIMLWTLREVNLSAYRKDLSEFIHGDGKKFVEKMLPIVFRLPEFYEYDIEFDEFKRDVTLEITQFNTGTHQKITTLRPVKSFYKNNKRVKQFEYWLKDDKGNAHMIAIEPKNPLKHIWDKLFTNQQIRIEGSYCPKQYDDLQYYRLLNWTVV
jgi:hypothetical protein